MREYDFETLFGSNQFKDFGYIDREETFRVVYPLASQQFPIGYINDRNTPADLGRVVVDKTPLRHFGLIHHVQLAHNKHNVVVGMAKVEVTENQIDRAVPSVTIPCDGLIITRSGKPFVVETFLSDCACVVIWSKDHVGYMHVGRPEIMEDQSVIETFFTLWPCRPEETRVWIGPSIGGKYYELPQIPDDFKSYAIETIWGTQGFCLLPAIVDQIRFFGLVNVRDITATGIDPFALNLSGDHSWAASDQWYRRKGRELGFPIYSPRNSAMLFVEG